MVSGQYFKGIFMFIIFLTVLAGGLAAVCAHVYTALTLAGQTVEYSLKAVAVEQYTQGILAYALADIAYSESLRQHLEQVKRVSKVCDLFYTSADGFVSGAVTYDLLPDGYIIEIAVTRSGQAVGRMRAQILRESGNEKVVYSCVALQSF